MKPSYWLCGGGGDINCPHWDDVNGCWLGCTSFDDEYCEGLLFEEGYDYDDA